MINEQITLPLRMRGGRKKQINAAVAAFSMMAAPPENEAGQYQPRARTKHVVVTVGNKMYVWGGWAGTDQYSRTLATYLEIFDFTSGVWNCKQTKGVPPRGLIDPAYACVGGRKLYVFGGYDGMAHKRCTNDLHQLDLNTLEWKKVVPNNYLDVVGNPRPMYGARMVARDDLLVMYGGIISPGDQSCGDVFIYDIQNGIWEKMVTSGSKPPKLNGHTLTKIDGSRVVLFGGQTEGKCINDVYILSMDTWSWSKISVRGIGMLGTGPRPSPRTNHSACCITGTGKPVVLITGGKSYRGTVLDEFWIMDLDNRMWRQVDVGDQEKPRHSHSTVMFETGRERVVTVTNGGQNATEGQPLGFTFPYLINSVFHLERETKSQNWIVTKIIYKQKKSAKPTPSVPASNARQSRQTGNLSEDILRGLNNHLQPLRHQHQFNDDIVNPHSSLPGNSTVKQQEDKSELIKAKNRVDEMEKRANEMEKRATDAEKNLFLTLQELTRVNDKFAALQLKLTEVQQKATLLEQRVQSQQDDAHENSSQAEENAMAAIQRALNAEESATSAKVQLTQAEEQVNLVEERLTQANQTIRHLQQQLSTAEQHATQAEHRTEEVMDRLTQMERRAVEAEARVIQAERSAQLSQHQAFNSEMRAREAERQVAEAEQQVRDTNVRRERAERRAAYVDRGEERLWALEREEITLTDVELGRGGWAAVKVAEFRGIRVAAKCIYNNILSDYNRALFVREMNMAARLRHPNLVQFIGATIHGEPLILMELMPTTLRLELRHGPPNREQILAISKDVAKALNYMHLMQPDSLIHRDVSSANVLLDPAPNDCWKVKLSDYGSVNFVQRTVSAGPGNPLYAAPEANNPDLHSTKMDVYSYGVLLSEMCSGLFPDADHRILVERVDDEQMADLIGHCLANEHDRRPTMSRILAILNEL